MGLLNLCDECICQPVCEVYRATGGVGRCEHCHMVGRTYVASVVHGHWKDITGGMVILGDCSECKVRQPVIGTNYCKNCGAKMKRGM